MFSVIRCDSEENYAGGESAEWLANFAHSPDFDTCLDKLLGNK